MIVKVIEWAQKNIFIVKALSYTVLVMLVVADLFVPREHPHFIGDFIPGFWAVFGFVSCVLIIVVSKWLGKKFLFRPEDYYEDEDEGEGNDYA